MEDKNYTIIVENVSKSFHLSRKRVSALKKIHDFLTGKYEKKRINVLENISFDVEKGKRIGIIGKNGSGKSTLLRIIAGIYTTDKGTIQKNGKILYLTGFGHGLKPRLTMKENIFLIGAFYGLTSKEIKKRYNDIITFSGLSKFIDSKVSTFSSGMQTRLSISIGLHCISESNPDILLVDEALGGGADLDFQKKSSKKMDDLIKSGATVLIVSHNLNYIRKNCHIVILLDNGKIISVGNPEEVVSLYEKLNK